MTTESDRLLIQRIRLNDQKAWTELRSTTQAKTVVTGLTPGATYFFRVQALTKDGEGNFCQPVSLVVT